MNILVADAPVLFELERAELLVPCFRLPHQFAVADVLYERDLRNHGGPELVRYGLDVVTACAEVSASAARLARRCHALSVADAFALAQARANDWHLLSCNDEVHGAAAALDVACHDVSWAFDELSAAGLISPDLLGTGHAAITGRPRCRLPPDSVQHCTSPYQDPPPPRIAVNG